MRINYWFQKLQSLRNQFISHEIATKFQENEVSRIISIALDTATILDEVNSNLVETKEIVRNNRSFYVTFIGFIFALAFQQTIEDFVKNNTCFIVIGVGVILFMLGVAYFFRNEIRRKLKI